MAANPPPIALWQISLDVPPRIVAQAVALLDVDERVQHRRFATADLARAFALRRAARRLILARSLGCQPGDVAIRTGAEGKPSCPGLAFSASHSGSCAVVAVARAGALGVDIEALRPLRADALAQRILSPGERSRLAELAEDRRPAELIRLWTVKEAVIKAERTGLDLAALPGIEVPAMAPDWQEVQSNSRWHTQSWMADGYAVALATSSPAAVERHDADPLLSALGPDSIA